MARRHTATFRGVSVLLGVVLLLAGCASGRASSGSGSVSSAAPSSSLAATPATRIRYMPLGDSITWGYGAPGGYRTVLWKQLVKRDHDLIDFVGSQASGPAALGDPQNEGHVGWCISGPCSGSGDDLLAPRVKEFVNRYHPDVISIHAGTNDILRGASGQTTAARLDDLVDRIFAGDPDVYLILVQIIPTETNVAEHNAYNALIPSVADKYRSRGHKVTVVDMSHLLTEPGDYQDGVHPTRAGYGRMGQALYPAVTQAYHEVASRS